MKVGDVVIIRTLEEVLSSYGVSTIERIPSPGYDESMADFGGMSTTVTELNQNGNVLLNIDKGTFAWSPKMLQETNVSSNWWY